MATYPPPFSPREQARAQARAQRDAYRAQRDYMRAQRRPSVVRPLILIAIGILALLIETGKISGPAFWDWYVRWWPLLLIGLGLLSLGEWWIDRDSPYGSRRVGSGIIFLIILMAMLGSASHRVRNNRGWQWLQNQSGDDDFSFHMFGQEHDADVTLDQAIPANAAVRIRNPHGDVLLSASTDGRVHVTAHDVAYASSDKDGKRQLERVAPKLNVSGSTVEIESADINGAHADLTVSVPEGVSLDIDAGHGDVSVDGSKGAVKVDSGHGDVKLNNLEGPVTAHMSKGDVSATGVSGPVAIDGRMNDVTLSNIKGNVAINGDFFGDMHLQDIASPVSLHSSRTDIKMEAITGDLTLDKGDLNFKNVTGPVRVVTHSSDVEGTLVRGATHIENSNGDVSLSVVAPVGDVDVHNDNGSIDLTLPAQTGFNLDASTANGDLSTDFDVPTTGSDDRHTASGKVGAGGSRISVVSSRGDVHIKKAGSVAASSDETNDGNEGKRPSPPKPPKSARHLHSSTAEEPHPAVQ